MQTIENFIVLEGVHSPFLDKVHALVKGLPNLRRCAGQIILYCNMVWAFFHHLFVLLLIIVLEVFEAAGIDEVLHFSLLPFGFSTPFGACEFLLFFVKVLIKVLAGVYHFCLLSSNVFEPWIIYLFRTVGELLKTDLCATVLNILLRFKENV